MPTKPKFTGAQRKVAREVLESFGLCGRDKEEVAERARGSESFAASLRLLDSDPRPYVETQCFLHRAMGACGPGTALTDAEFAERAAWLMAENERQPPPVPTAEYKRRVGVLYEPLTPDWPS